MSILLYGCNTWTLTKRMEWGGGELDGNISVSCIEQVLEAASHEVAAVRTPTTKTIQVRRTRHVRHCWRSKDELISDVLLWTPLHGRARLGLPARTYLQQFCTDTGGRREYLPKTMNDRDGWREKFREIRTYGTSWWWYLYYLFAPRNNRCVSYCLSFLHEALCYVIAPHHHS